MTYRHQWRILKSHRHGNGQVKDEKLRYKGEEPDLTFPLPGWIPSLAGASFAMYEKAGAKAAKLGRKNADTLVGLPTGSQSFERNYNAAETKGLDLNSLRFVKRATLGHWSMYVRGFVLDTVTETFPSSQGGAIPESWAKAGGWDEVPESDPPDEFYRCLVADRGRDGRNPPVYYSRACKESFAKGGLSSGSVNLTDLINNERCSIIAQFCRRVQSVIWNRSLIKTLPQRPRYDSDPESLKPSLGLAAQGIRPRDLICILYGCSVPVALRRQRKTKEEVEQEIEDELRGFCRQVVVKYLDFMRYRRYRRMIKNLDRPFAYLIHQRMQEAWSKDSDGRRAWLDEKQETEVRAENRRKSRWKVRRQTDPSYETVATLTGGKFNESIKECLERRAFEDWKRRKRTAGFFKEEWLRIEDRRAFQRAYKFGHRWLILANLRRPGSTPGDTDTIASDSWITYCRNTLAKVGCFFRQVPVSPESNGSQIVLDEKTSKEKRQRQVNEIRNIANDFRKKFQEECIRKYVSDKTSAVLVEPDWTEVDKDSLAIQDRWNYYEFLGECYRHGMMDGEAMRYQNQYSIPTRTFELR